MTAEAPAELNVYLGPEDGTNPTVPDDLAEYLRPLQIVRSAGGRTLDHAVFAYDLGFVGERIVDLMTPLAWNRVVEVRHVSAGGTERLVFRGDLVLQTLRLDARTEQAIVIARVEPYHFGDVLRGQLQRHPLRVPIEDVTIDVDPVFNPEIDGIIQPNMSSESHEDLLCRLWIDPESLWTTEASVVQDAGAELWRLKWAIDSLCFAANPDETFILNPNQVEDPIFDDAPALYDFRLPRGRLLPDYLDALLEQHGYGWYVKPSIEDDEGVLRIRIYRRGEGTERALRLQRPGESLDVALSNVPQLTVETSVADLANVIVVTGALQEREITVSLQRTWETSDDALTAEELDKSDPDSDFISKPHVWRLWMMNESAELAGRRPEIGDHTGDLEQAGVFDLVAPRRRRFFDCLTLDVEGGARRKPFLEWWVSEEARWEAAPDEWQWTILQDRCGILFTGNTPPYDLIAEGADARLRITATVRGDQRITATSTSAGASPNGRDVPLQIDAPERFFDRQRQTGGAYASVLTGPADERDDASAIQAFADALRAIEEPASIAASPVLRGITFEYEIGDLITGVDGRAISFNRASVVGTPVYPQVTQITWDVPQQKTILGLSAEQPKVDRKTRT